MIATEIEIQSYRAEDKQDAVVVTRVGLGPQRWLIVTTGVV